MSAWPPLTHQDVVDKIDTLPTTYIAAGTIAEDAVSTLEATTSASMTDLATVGPAVTVTIGSSGRAWVFIQADVASGTIDTYAVMGFAISGATTLAAGDRAHLRGDPENADVHLSSAMVQTGLAAGSTTFTMKYQAPYGSSQSFSARRITVIPL